MKRTVILLLTSIEILLVDVSGILMDLVGRSASPSPMSRRDDSSYRGNRSPPGRDSPRGRDGNRSSVDRDNSRSPRRRSYYPYDGMTTITAT